MHFFFFLIVDIWFVLLAFTTDDSVSIVCDIGTGKFYNFATGHGDLSSMHFVH